MSGDLYCPHCGLPVNPQVRYCDHCGVDLAVAAVLAEQRMALPARLSTGAPLAPEILVPRIGDYLIERGLLEPGGLQRALAYQKETAAQGRNLLLGQALLELNLIDREVLDQVVTAQILELQNALNASNQNLKQRVEERTQELQQALEHLSELNQLKSNFIANISHELRTPLTHIKGYLDLLVENGLGPLNQSQSEAVTVMRRAEARLERLIEDLIQFSMSSRGDLNLNIQRIDLAGLTLGNIDRLQTRARAVDIMLLAEIPGSLPKVSADGDKIGWVIQQLLDNALKFTHQGGKVLVQIEHENGLVNISVIDTGIGIPANKLDEIFEPFHQLDGSATRRYAGTGLGMAMVRRIIEAHGSQVKVRSVPGQGSCFEFSLAIALPAA
ncbi:MAG: ATP-binding protein [Chloroflexota bacterium]